MPSHDHPNDNFPTDPAPEPLQIGQFRVTFVNPNQRLLLAQSRVESQQTRDVPAADETMKSDETERRSRAFALGLLIAATASVYKASSPPPEISPPSSFWLSAMLPADVSEEVIANMEELHQESWLPRYGRRRANMIWHLQVVQFVLWRWTWPVVSLLGALKLIKLG